MIVAANLTFLPWARQGAASSITVPDSQTGAQDAVVTVAASLTLNTKNVPGVQVKLRGPADPTGIDVNQIVRTDPRPGTTDFEPNCFPSIEFDRPDFPWLFTPATENAANRLRPWLCLIVVRKQPGVTLDGSGGLPTTKLTIDGPANPAAELPDLQDSWAWAHAQVTADANRTAVDTAFGAGPEQSLSRLICPRILAAETEYIACVVPTFDLGRRAGLGQTIPDTDLFVSGGGKPLAPAWVISPAKIELPVFYSWEFRTGQDGSFESLAKGLTSHVPAGLGKRTIDISHPCFPAGGATTLELEGALLPVTPPPAQQAPDPIPVAFKTTLASIINEPSRVAATDLTKDPLLAPPMYGRWHAAKPVTSPTGTTWFDQLNLDPRWRAAAAFGTRVIQEHQEALMTSAWDQAAEIAAANQRKRQLQMSMCVGDMLHRRHFALQTSEKMLRLAAPAFARLKDTATPMGESLLACQYGTSLPPAANRSAMRRIGRQRGPLTRRVAIKQFPRKTDNTWVAWMNGMWAGPLPAASPTPAPLVFASLPSIPAATQILHDAQPGQPKSFCGAFLVAAEFKPVPKGSVGTPLPDTEAPDFFRTAMSDHLEAFFPPRTVTPKPPLPTYTDVRQMVLAQMKPSVALQKLVNAVVVTGDRVLPPTAPGVKPSGMEVVAAPPYFPQPMYESLRDLSQELLLPGLETVPPDTVLGLKTNRQFLEAFMVGLNHEMGRELLWRGYPTDQRATYFDHFWGDGVPNTAPKDITDINTWTAINPATKQMRKLGDAFGAPQISEEFVMLLRSSLLKRYPNAIIALVKGIQSVPGSSDPSTVIPDPSASDIMPMFSGSMVPDVAFFGFPIPTATAVGGGAAGPGYFVIIQEHPTEPRFGIDVAVAKSLATTHLVVGATPPPTMVPAPTKWNTHAADMAHITRRLPTHMAIHASRLIAPT